MICTTSPVLILTMKRCAITSIFLRVTLFVNFFQIFGRRRLGFWLNDPWLTGISDSFERRRHQRATLRESCDVETSCDNFDISLTWLPGTRHPECPNEIPNARKIPIACTTLCDML